MIGKIEGKLYQAMSDEMTPKFLATVGNDGQPSVVLVATIMPNGDEKMAFANFLMNNTAKNLNKESKTGALVITEDLMWWSMTTDFTGWDEKGPLVDAFNSNELFRYNAYTGVRNVGKLDLNQMIDEGQISKLSLLADFGFTGMTKRKFSKKSGVEKMPMTVVEKFGRIAAIKVLSYIRDDGYPICIPILSAQPADKSTLVFGTGCAPRLVEDIPEGAQVAINVVTFEPVSYQVKGTFTGYSSSVLGKKGVVKIDSVWCTSPPLCGERIDVDLKNKKNEHLL